MNYYWLDKHLKLWHEAVLADRKPQAVIISGPEGIGKRALLKQIVADLLCRKSTPACGECQNCRLNLQGYHPDVDTLEPENELIKVKMIRELTDFFVSTPHCSDHKLAIINGAHLMNTAAANALLKVLEEPPSRGLLFLVTDSKHKLMPTIRSRCINLDVVINQSEKQQLLSWIAAQGQFSDKHIEQALVLSDWNPFAAIELLESDGVKVFTDYLNLIYTAVTAQGSVSEVAKQLADVENTAIWYMFNQYLNDLAKSVLRPELENNSVEHALNQLIKKMPKVLHLVMKLTDQINLIMLNLNTQVKKQLLIESMLIDFKKAVSN